jgi:acyl-CoA synthetase (AMP-forming)/AMP-acid ligase II
LLSEMTSDWMHVSAFRASIGRVKLGDHSVLFGDILRQSARRHPQKTALIGPNGETSYSDLDALSNRFAHAVASLGLSRGDAVAIMSRNVAEFAVAIFGIARTGCLLVNLSPAYGPRELIHILNKTRARVLIIEADLLDRILPLRSGLAHLEHLITIGAADEGVPFARFIADRSSADPEIRLDANDPFILTFTGGTTGLPKGALCSHRARYVSAYTTVIEHELAGNDVCGVVTPMYHAVGGYVWFPGAILLGCTCVLLPRWNPKAFADLAARHAITAVLMVPVQLKETLEDPDFDAAKLASLKKIGVGGATAAADLIAAAATRLPHAPITDHYGQSETGPLTILKPWHPRSEWESVGRPAVGVDLDIVDPTGRPIAVGEIGEIVARGPFLMEGYFEEPGETAAYFRNGDGWGWTGDLGVRNAAGFITLVGRSKDMIVSGGVNVYPREVEAVLEDHPAVAECTAFGVPDEKWGEALVAYVVVRRGAEVTADALIDTCARELARFKRPREVHFVGVIPKTATGKIQKQLLKDAYLASRTSG